MRNKVLMIITIAIASILIGALYFSEYNIRDDMASFEKGISDYLEKDVEVRNRIEINRKILVSFNLKSDEQVVGLAQFHKGLFGFNQIRRASHGYHIPFGFHYIHDNNENYFIVYGENYNLEINYLKFKFGMNTYSFDVKNQSYFLEAQTFDEPSEFYDESMLINVEGKNIKESYIEKYFSNDKKQSSSSKTKMELFMLDVFIIIIASIAFAILMSLNKNKEK